MKRKLKGLIAAPFTAFDTSGELYLPVIDRQLELLTANGISGALVNGTTGECGSLTLEERMMVATRWCEAARAFEDFAVVVHVGHSCLKDSQTLAAHAQKIGATASMRCHIGCARASPLMRNRIMHGCCATRIA